MSTRIQTIERDRELCTRVKYEIPGDPTMAAYWSHVQVVERLENGQTEVLVGTPPAAEESLSGFDVVLIASLLLGKLVRLDGEPTKLNWGESSFTWVAYSVVVGDT